MISPAPGSVIISQGGPWLLKQFMRTPWTHVAIVTGHDTIVHAMAFRGVREEYLQPYLEDVAEHAIGILRIPGLSPEVERAAGDYALKYVGRRYDYLQALSWYATGRFWSDGEQRLICSRLITACYYNVGVPLFDAFDLIARGVTRDRRADLMQGYCTPASLLAYSKLRMVESFDN